MQGDAGGIEGVRFHDLRHTHASLLLAANVPIHVVQARLGHASIQITVDTYGHLMPNADAQAALQFDHFVNGLFRKYVGNDHHVDLDGPRKFSRAAKSDSEQCVIQM
ncbi:MAG: tyrosine-type recombinase/integrase [Dehalococcoidia bacterium]|nr:tyrosine-type recombinase/integrase [Dehalococcoidia bacterium]